ncbi:hypothetical protein MTO96_017376 [Rhipicephalus appendiculatus]
MDVQVSNSGNVGDSATVANASSVAGVRDSSQVTAPFRETFDHEAVLVRATTTHVTSEVAAEVAASMNRTLSFALCTGFLILVASLVSVFVWYGVIVDPAEILRKAGVRVGRGAPAANPAGSASKTSPRIVQYLGMPLTFLPDEWNRGHHDNPISTAATSSFASGVAGFSELSLEVNATDRTMLPAPL